MASPTAALSSPYPTDGSTVSNHFNIPNATLYIQWKCTDAVADGSVGQYSGLIGAISTQMYGGPANFSYVVYSPNEDPTADFKANAMSFAGVGSVNTAFSSDSMPYGSVPLNQVGPPCGSGVSVYVFFPSSRNSDGSYTVGNGTEVALN
jgi:hypothetical protein